MRALVIVALVLVPAAAQAQEELTLDAYLYRVGQSNLPLAAQRANVSIARAQIAIGQTFPDPVLTGGASTLDLSHAGVQNVYGASVSIPFEWPGKRAARIAAAKANADVVGAQLADFGRLLRAAATTAWVDALLAQRVSASKKQTAESLARITQVNEERQAEGAASEIVVLQSHLEARRAQSEVAFAQGEVESAQLALRALLAREDRESPMPALKGDLRFEPRQFSVNEAVETALRERPDLAARALGVVAAQSQLDLAQANRGLDVAVNLGWAYTMTGGEGTAYAGPAYHTAGAQLSVPLPFSRVYSGEVQASRAGQAQAQTLLEAERVRIATETRTAFSRYEAAKARLAALDDTLLLESDRMLEMARYSFAQGASRLTDLLSAQRTWSETHLAWETARADHVKALIALETATTAWDLTNEAP